MARIFLFFQCVIAICAACALSPSVAKAEHPVVILDPGHGGDDQGGYDGRGFVFEDGRRVSESAYVYDIAQRIIHRLPANSWQTLLTVISDRGVVESSPPALIPPLSNLSYNFLHKNVRVFGGKEGVEMRLEAIREFPFDPSTHRTVFLSLHFDYAPSHISGVRIFTTRALARHPFVLTLAREFADAQLPLQTHGKTQQSITVNENLIVLKDGTVSPRVLLELGNWNNAADRDRLLSPEGREQYAATVSSALAKYFTQSR